MGHAAPRTDPLLSALSYIAKYICPIPDIAIR
jgi:hypothetical protein